MRCCQVHVGLRVAHVVEISCGQGHIITAKVASFAIYIHPRGRQTGDRNIPRVRPEPGLALTLWAILLPLIAFSRS